MLLMLNSCRQKICVNLMKKEKCIHIQMYICSKSITLGVQNMTRGIQNLTEDTLGVQNMTRVIQNLTGDTEFDSSPCHILHRC